MLTLLAMMLAPSTAQAASSAPPEKPRLICRESQQETGSHIRTGRRCKTAEQWAREVDELDRIPPTMRITKGQEDGRPVQQPQ